MTHCKHSYHALAAALLVSGVAGCAVGPDYRRPEVSLPQAWNAAAEPGVQIASKPEQAPQIRWWSEFNDPLLNQLITEASTENLSLKAALLRVKEARGARRLAIGAVLPQINIDGEFKRERLSEGLDFPVPESFGGENFYRAGFDASWEIDVFGGRRRDIEAATAEAEAQVDAARDVLVTVLSEVSRNYVELRTTQWTLSVARKNLETQQKSLDLTRLRFDGGMGNRLDVARAEALYSQTAAEIPNLEADERILAHSLAILLGKQPTELLARLAADCSAAADPKLPNNPPVVPVGLPSNILRRRPDVRQAEQQLIAANARIGVATADLFPKFTLVGTFGSSTREVSDFAKEATTYWSAGPGMTWPILQAGTILANVEIQENAEQRALLEYRIAILNALKDVEDSLIRLSREQQRSQDLKKSVEANELAVRLARESYEQGLVDFLNVLQTESDLFAVETSYVRSQGAVSKAVISVYKALGGGWETDLPAAPEDGPPQAMVAQQTVTTTTTK